MGEERLSENVCGLSLQESRMLMLKFLFSVGEAGLLCIVRCVCTIWTPVPLSDLHLNRLAGLVYLML
jgi:hypothetical protein